MNRKEIAGGCICVIITMMLMTGLVYYLIQSEDPETFQAGLSLSNNTGYDVEVRIYVHGDSRWDIIQLWISNGTQKDMTVEWENDLVDVLILYNINGETKVFVHHLEPKEWRYVLMV